MGQIKDQRIISGLFREALFHNSEINIQISDENDPHQIAFYVESIEEKSARDQGYRLIWLTPIEAETAIPTLATSSKPLDMVAYLPRFVAHWSGAVVHQQDNRIAIALPELIFSEDQRKRSPRTDLPKAQQVEEHEVLVRTDSLFTQAFLTVTNLSQTGAGGLLRIPCAFPLRVGSSISGLVSLTKEKIHIQGSLAFVQLLPQSFTNNQSMNFRVGIEFKTAPSKTEGEKREFKRNESEVLLEFTSPLNQEHLIQVNCQELSVTGFSGHLSNSEDSRLLPVGCVVTLKYPAIQAELVAFSGDTHRFRILPSETHQHTHWLKIVTPKNISSSKLSTNVASGLELIDLFCESGALASSYVKEQKHIFDVFSKQLGSTTSSDTWVHRWMEKNSDGKIKGHISSIRYADSIWYMGDLAGRIQDDLKISHNFITSYFDHFREFALSESPCPSIFWLWFEGHPYWSKFNTFLQSKKEPDLRAYFPVGYYRYTEDSLRSLDNHKITWESIRANQSSVIQAITNSITDENHKRFLRLLDFSIETFGSPQLRAELARSGTRLDRKYWKLNLTPNKTFLVIYQRFPLGVSPTRTPEVPWLIPLGTTQLSELSKPELQSILAEVNYHGLNQGYSFPGVLATLPDSKCPEELKAMRVGIFHPSLLEFFTRGPTS